MSGVDKCECKINYQGSQPLALIDQTLEHGKFTTSPDSKITSEEDPDVYHSLFKAEGRSASYYGTTGSVTYQAIDETIFTIHFDSPWGTEDPKSKNYITADRNTGNWDYGQHKYNDENHKVEVKYYIRESN